MHQIDREVFSQKITHEIVSMFKRLLSEKHLYQSVSFDRELIRKTTATIWGAPHAANRGLVRIGNEVSPWTKQLLEDEAQQLVNGAWIVAGGIPLGDVLCSHGGPIPFETPFIETYCGVCKDREPHNAMPSLSSYSCIKASAGVFRQSFKLTFECQGCHRSFVTYLVARFTDKLTLCGRDPIEHIEVPKVLPNAQAKYFSDAIVMHQAGFSLAGLFMLRVFVEQYWRSTDPVKILLSSNPRATGEEQGDAYASILHETFSSRFPSLQEVYSKLSAAVHTAKYEETLFDEIAAKIVGHFEARQLFEKFPAKAGVK